jgi:hypothetical protein
VTGKETTQKAKLVDQESPEAKAYHSRRDSEVAAEVRKAMPGKCEWKRYCSRHAHHANCGSSTEDEQINRCPDWVVNRGQDQ